MKSAPISNSRSPAFLLGTYVITMSGGVENHGGVNKIPMEDSIDAALVHLVCTEHLLGQCGVVLKGL